MVKKVWRTDRRTDGQTDGLNQSYSCLVAAKNMKIIQFIKSSYSSGHIIIVIVILTKILAIGLFWLALSDAGKHTNMLELNQNQTAMGLLPDM